MTLVKILAWGLLAYLIYAGLLLVFQRHVLFPRYQIPDVPDPSIPNTHFEKIWLKTGFGNTEAWFLSAHHKAPTEAKPVLIFAHGNAELIDFWPDEFSRFASHGIAVFLVEYPGYGRSAGHPSQKTITETFTAAYDYVVERSDVDPSRVILMGRSLGGGAVCALGSKRPCAAMILMSTFTSIKTFAKRFLVPPALVRDPFDNLAFVSTFNNPVLVIHGKQDDLIPLSHGLKLARAAKNARMHTYACKHNDCPPSWEQLEEDIILFLREAGVIEQA